MVAIIIVVIIVIVLFAIMYNNLVSRKNSVENALSTIDTFLQERLDLMTNLFEQAAISLKHESEVYEKVSELRSEHDKVKADYTNKKDNKEIVNIDKNISKIGKQFKAVYENYPDLKAIDTVHKAMDANIVMENQINAARRNYNNNIMEYRNAIQSFPTVLFARIFGFKDNYELYKADEEAKQRVKASDVYKSI